MTAFSKTLRKIVSVFILCAMIIAAAVPAAAVSSFDGAIALTAGQTVSGQLGSDTQVHDYKLTSDKNGYISVTFTGDESAFVSVFNESGEELTASAANKAVPSLGVDAGTCYFRVTCSQAANYKLTAGFTASAAWESEPNNSTVAADNLALSGEYCGSFSGITDADYYTFTLSRAGLLTFGTEYDGELRVVITDDNGNRICSYSGGNTSSDIGLDAGKYYISLVSSKHSAADYKLQMNFTVSSEWESEPNNGTATADALTAGKKMNGNLFSSDDKDRYTFTLTEAAYVTLDFSAEKKTASPSWALTVMDTAAEQMYYKSFSASGYTDEFLLEAGKYIIELAPIAHSDSNYSVKLNISDRVVISRMGGANRIDTALEISRNGWDSGSCDTVIIANGFNFPDALAGVPLAYELDAPILLTSGGTALEPAVINEIKRLGAKKAYILGGTGVVPENIEKELNSITGSAERLAGDDRYGTAIAISKKLAALNGGSKTVYLACGLDFPDALSISPAAALQGAPVLYMPRTGAVNEVTSAYIKAQKFTSAVIIGGTGAVSSEGADSIKALGLSVSRIGGSDRYETSVNICRKYENLFSGSGIALATGLNFPDALAGGVFAAKRAVPVVLVRNNPADVTVEYITAADPSVAYIFGGEGVIPDSSDIAPIY